MRRRGKRGSDSLDLLLDTICNTFGGVLFIALLVVILLNLSSETVTVTPPTLEAQRRMLQAQAELTDSEAELESLRRAARQRQRLRDQFSDSRTEELVSQMQRIDSQNAQLSSQRDESLQQTASAQQTVNEAVTEIQRLREAQERLQAALRDVQEQLEREIARRSRTARFPKQQATQKSEVAFLLKEGRLCALARVVSGQVAKNTDEVRELSEGDRAYVEPVPSAGLAIDPDGEDRSAIESRFQQFDKDKFFLTVVVWPDSFSHFAAVKEAMVQLEYEYRLIPWSGDEKLYVGARSEQSEIIQR